MNNIPHVVDTGASVTEKRYCTSCEVMRPADYGKMIKAGKVNRWKCTACTLKINIPKYAKKAQK
jgi:hypothetical protein